MKYYRQIYPEIWTGKTGRLLRGDPVAQVIVLYLITNRHSNYLGLYYLPLALIAHETGIPLLEAPWKGLGSPFQGASEGLQRDIEGTSKGVQNGMQKLIEHGFCAFDESTDMVWVREMAHYQLGGELDPKDHRCKNIRTLYAELPETFLLSDFFDRYQDELRLTERRGENLKPPDEPSQNEVTSEGLGSTSEAPSKGLGRGLEGASVTATATESSYRKEGTPQPAPAQPEQPAKSSVPATAGTDPEGQVLQGDLLPATATVDSTAKPLTSQQPLPILGSVEKRASVRPIQPKDPAPTTETWNAYALAYEDRYGAPPVRNAKVNGQLAQLVKRLGGQEAPAVAAFFVRQCNSAYYCQRMHSVDCLLADAEKLRTEWITGRQMTAAKAREADRMQTTVDIATEASRLYEERKAARLAAKAAAGGAG